MAEQPSLLGRAEGRAAPSSAVRPTSCSSAAASSEVGAQARMQLRGLAAERRHADRVLEQPARVGVVRLGAPAGRGAAARSTSSSEKPRHASRAGPGARSRAARNSRKPSSSSASRRIAGTSAAGSASSAASSDRTSSCSRSRKRSTRPSTRTASPSPKRASSSSTSVPDARVDPAARVDELEREVRSAALRAPPLLAGDRVDALDDAVLGQLCDRAHAPSLGPSAAAYAPARVAEVNPFRAVRYDEDAGSLDDARRPAVRRHLPGRARASYLARNPYNVVHLTLPDRESEAGRIWRDWREDETCSSTSRSRRFWWLSQDYVGPDGVARTARGTRRGAHGSSRTSAASSSRTSARTRAEGGPAAAAARGACPARADASCSTTALRPPHAPPARDARPRGPRATTRSGGSGRRRSPRRFADRQLLIADGHHRYETALASRRGRRLRRAADGRLVSTDERRADDLPDAPRRRSAEPERAAAAPTPLAGDARRALARSPADHAAAVVYARWAHCRARPARQRARRTACVEQLGHEGIATRRLWTRPCARSTPARPRPRSCCARPPIEEVRAVAQRGETMPQKSTYFYPKLVTGLLFLPL